LTLLTLIAHAPEATRHERRCQRRCRSLLVVELRKAAVVAAVNPVLCLRLVAAKAAGPPPALGSASASAAAAAAPSLPLCSAACSASSREGSGLRGCSAVIHEFQENLARMCYKNYHVSSSWRRRCRHAAPLATPRSGTAATCAAAGVSNNHTRTA